MDMVLWLVAGAALGWIGITVLGFNQQRGTVVSMIIGAGGAILGGKMLAPLLATSVAVPGALNTSALMYAAIVAAVLLFISSLVHEHFGI